MTTMTSWTIIALVSLCFTSWASVLATPTITFPFNSQVPEVARRNQQYSFQLSSSTFEPRDNLTYSLAQQPAWLKIDSATRTLSGTPTDTDVGVSVFTITATDASGAAHMQCTLVIASDPAPRLKGDFNEQLAAEVNLTSDAPTTITLTPGTMFNFHFNQDSFIDIVQRKLYYYSTLANHTPLPAFLQFDANSLTFYGTAPQLSAFPQSFDVALTASDYEGFAGTTASFTIVISTKQLIFTPSSQEVHFKPGASLNYSLASSLSLNGKQVAVNTLKSANATLPKWLSFDSKSLGISGVAPQDAGNDTGNVVVLDGQGDSAQVTLDFTPSNITLFTGTIGTVVAYAGEGLNYSIPTSVISDSSVSLSLLVPTSADWLRLDPAAHIIYGDVPATATSLQATLQARSPTSQDVQTQAFDIKIESSTPTQTSTVNSTSNSASRLSGGSIAAIVIGVILGIAILIALLICCCCCRRRRRKQQQQHNQSSSPTRRLISGPTLVERNPDAIRVTTLVHTDVEKGQERDSADEDRPPQIALEIPAPHVRSARLGARSSVLSQVSSIGNGEDAIRRDANIPEWGHDSAVLHKPHDSFSIPTDIAKGSKHIRSVSPTKRRLYRLQDGSRQSVGLGIDTGIERKGTKKSSRARKKDSNAGLSATLDRSSIASLSTQATSLLSTRPSDFPRPPTQSTMSATRSIPTMLSLYDADKRRSVRMLRRSDSINDSRPLEQRRESFIRARASTSLQSPLFAHGSRIPTDHRAGRGSSSDVSSGILNRWRSRRLLGQHSMYSQSSLAVSERDSKRFSQRVRSAFAPNFPRVVSGSDYGDVKAIEEDGDEDWEDVTPSGSRVQSMQNMAAEIAKPRHLRNWVLPGEASPTPPPLSVGRQGSSARRSDSEARLRWKQRVGQDRSSSSFITTSTTSGDAGDRSPDIPRKSPKRSHSYFNEPLGLVGKDLDRSIPVDRPRLGETKMNRPVSVEKVERLSSFKAETVADTQAGGEIDDEIRDVEMTDGMRGTPRSQMSGIAFL